MADNVTYGTGNNSTPPTGTVVATDDDGTAQHQYVKVEFGGDGTFTKVTSAVGLPVSDAGGSLTVDNAALSVTGGGVEASALRVTVASDSTGVLSVDDNGGSLTIDNAQLSVVGGGTEAAALRVTIANDSTGVLSVDDNGGALTVDNGGTFAVQIDAGAVTSLALLDDVVFAEDVAASAADKGLSILAVRRDADTSLVGTDNDYAQLQVDANGRLKVEAFSGEALPVTLTSTTITGTVAVTQSGTWDEVGINDSGNSITVDNPQLSVVGSGTEAAAMRVTIATDSTGVLSVDDNGSTLSIDDGAGSITIDNAALAVVGGGVEATALRVTVASDSTGVLSIDDNGGSLTVDGTVAVTNADIATIAGAVRAEDAASADGHTGIPAMAIRDDTLNIRSGTEGDYEFLHTDANGALWVRHTSDAVTVASHAVTNAGTFAVQVDGAALTSLQLLDDAISGTEMQVDVVAALPAGNNNIGDVDVASVVPGTGATNLGKAEDAVHASGDVGVMVLGVRQDAQVDFGADGDYVALSIDADGQLRVNAGVVTASAAAEFADDAAFTLTSSKVSMSGAIRDDALAALAAVEGDAVPLRVDANGALWVHDDALDAALAGSELQVDVVAALPTGANTIGAVTNTVLSVVGGGTEATAQRVTIANDSTGVLSIDDNGGSLTVDGTVAVTLAAGAAAIAKAEDVASADADVGVPAMAVRKATPANVSGTDGDYEFLQISAGRLWASATIDAALPAGTNAIGKLAANSGVDIGDVDVLSINGQTAHDSGIAGAPVRIGGRAITADVTAVTTGDSVDMIATTLGKQITYPYAIPARTWNYAAPAGGLVSQTAVTIKAAGTGAERHYITDIQVVNSHATISTELMVLDGAAGTVLWRGWCQAAGGGYSIHFNTPLRGSAATLLEIDEVTATATAGVLFNCQGFTAAE